MPPRFFEHQHVRMDQYCFYDMFSYLTLWLRVSLNRWVSRSTFFADRSETRFGGSSGLDTPEKHRLLDRRTAGHINCRVASDM